jgi:hypothetical protein
VKNGRDLVQHEIRLGTERRAREDRTLPGVSTVASVLTLAKICWDAVGSSGRLLLWAKCPEFSKPDSRGGVRVARASTRTTRALHDIKTDTSTAISSRVLAV